MKEPVLPSFQSNALDLWWRRVPVMGRRLSRTLSVILADGLYLSAWPVVGALAPSLALVFGFLIGWFHFAPGETFTVSIVVMALMLAASCLSTALGWWLVVGYVAGDFFLFHHAPSYFGGAFVARLIHVRVPLLISYVLLTMLLVIIPLTSLALRRQSLARLKMPRTVAMTIEAGVQAVAQAGLVFIWSHATPTLIRPLYVWQGRTPPIEAIQPLQQHGWMLAALAAVTSVARILLEYRASIQPTVVQRAALLRIDLASVPPVYERIILPSWLKAFLKASFTTLLLAGILTTWLDAVVFALVVMLILLTREPLARVLASWIRRISRVPLLIRISASIVINFLVASQIVRAMWSNTSTFLPVLISVTASLIVFALLVPSQKPLSQK